MEWLTLSQTGFQQAARYLLGMRLSIAAIQLVALAIAEALIALTFRAEALLICLFYALFAVLGWLWFTRRPPKSALTVSAGLALDLVMIGVWLLLTGGYTSPFTALLLLPIAVAIVLVPLRQSIALTGLGIATYTVLVIWHTPVTLGEHGTDLTQLHLFGMWATFALTAAILLLVVGTLAHRVQRQQTQLAHIRETRLRDEQIIALGLSAAGIAHRLGTPLNTMTLLLEEMRSGDHGPAAREDLDLMARQLQLCNSHLQQLTSAAVQAKTAQPETVSVRAWLERLRESATLLWPAGALNWQTPFPDAAIAVDTTLDQAVLNLLANALSASPAWVSISARITKSDGVEIVVEDQGDGLIPKDGNAPGQDVVDSEHGLGVGLFLSNATIQRFGGTLKARSSRQGTTMIIELPRVPEEGEHD
ncbi:sensor histidine kinase [Marinobacter arenosus]|uniref:sensor histidine kinase n=1 Tax=Marinobacter arenosus TaxID=2856822 RepID=UPI001C4B6542|nr:HAMP domain-containing sensor histidine kinase [Marinobacter arenosus]MBW0148383.1 sensor histidine kinase [Marinobacter arenosus]